MRAKMFRLALTVAALVFTPAGSGESFEQDMGGWEADTDGKARDWRIYRTTDQAVDGTTGLGYYLDGRNDEGTIWVERAFSAPRNATVTVSASFWLHNTHLGHVNQWMVAGYAGTGNPETERDMMPPIDRTNAKPGWIKYSFTKKVQTDATGMVWIAGGIRATWEGRRTYHFDLVETSIIPR